MHRIQVGYKIQGGQDTGGTEYSTARIGLHGGIGYSEDRIKVGDRI